MVERERERGRGGGWRRLLISVSKSLRNKPSLMTQDNMDGMLVRGRGREETQDATAPVQDVCLNPVTDLRLLWI